VEAALEARFDEPAFYLGDPHPMLSYLRANDPLHWYERGDFWVVTKYDDIRFISSRPDLFSSKEIAIAMDLKRVREGTELPHQNRGVMFMDPPEHAAHRKAVSHRFTPQAVAAMEPHVRSVVTDAFDRLPGDEFDWIEHVAETVPVFVFSSILGVPESDWHQVVAWATTITNVGSGNAGPDDMELIFNEVGPYLWTLVAERQANPQDDLLTLLTQVEVDSKPFDEEQIITYALTLLAAGSETTQSLIAGLGDALCAHADQAAVLFDDPTKAANTVEETMRWWTPVVSMARRATSDVELRGRTIKAGDGVLLLYASANRDEDRFGVDADEFRIGRSNASAHLGFGFGEHFCIGAHLARREGRMLLEELASRYRAIEACGAGERRESVLVHTHDRFRVRLTPR
jgi:cytochrome P450